MPGEIRAWIESWPITGEFVISRGRKTEAEVVVVEIDDGAHRGRGECVPYARYGEGPDQVCRAIEALGTIETFGGLEAHRALPGSLRGAALNAVDSALWDLEANRAQRPVWELANLPSPGPIETAYTLSIGPHEAMAARVGSHRVLKLKLAGDGLDLQRVRSVRDAAPHATLWLDANEAWSVSEYESLVPELVRLGVALIEQPFPAGDDHVLGGLERPIPICADESFLGLDAALPPHYDALNIKLDKNGGLTGALESIRRARSANLLVVIGCMVSTSLSLAPACLLAGLADYCDLDGALLLDRDRSGGCILNDEGYLIPPTLWGFLHSRNHSGDRPSAI